MNRAAKTKLKLSVLQVIKTYKEQLFASIQNNATTKLQKEEAWRVVLCKAQSVGLARATHDWTYARDKLYGLWKSRTLSKRDNTRRNSTGSMRNSKLDEIDYAILDILGNDCPAVNGLEPESSTDSMQVLANDSHIPACRIGKKRKRPTGDDEYNELQKELLQVEIYKNKLQVLQLERQLNLPPSKYTVNISQVLSPTAESINVLQDELKSEGSNSCHESAHKPARLLTNAAHFG